MQNLDSNQTQFSELSPVFESDKVAPTKNDQEQAAVKAKPKSKLMLIAGAAALFFVILLVVILMMIKQTVDNGGLNNGDNGQVIDSTNGEIDPLLQEIYDLDDQLQASDPSLDEIPLPPVDMTLRLDPAKKR